MRPTLLTFVDVETTGLSPELHEVVEVATVRTSLDGRTVLERWECLMLAEHLERAQPEALAVNAYSAAEWQGRNAWRQEEGAAQLAQHLDGATLVSQTTYDVAMLRATLIRHGHEPGWQRHTVDVASLAWPLLLALPELPGVSLKYTSRALGLTPEPVVHRASAGAELARQVYVALMDRFSAVPR